MTRHVSAPWRARAPASSSGIGLQMTLPGVLTVCAGDELGLEGAWAEDGRRTMPWDRPESWDDALFDGYRELIALRRSSTALARGGFRLAYVDSDTIAYLREAPDERILCLAGRGAHDPVRIPPRSSVRATSTLSREQMLRSTRETSCFRPTVLAFTSGSSTSLDSAAGAICSRRGTCEEAGRGDPRLRERDDRDSRPAAGPANGDGVRRPPARGGKGAVTRSGEPGFAIPEEAPWRSDSG